MITDNNRIDEEKIRQDMVKSQALCYLYKMLHDIKSVSMEEFIKMYIENQLAEYINDNILSLLDNHA